MEEGYDMQKDEGCDTKKRRIRYAEG